MAEMIHVEVVFATPQKQQIVALELPAGTSVREAALKSGLDAQFEGLDLAKADLGVFGKAVPKPDDTPVANGDRVEIYRPLIADPKEVRKQRAAKVKARQEAEGRR
ncbi:MAG TPA: RnfH family protein [Spongiibacteraceae bacterium]|nr:RnfH family protein [Spongiibacteraceae bacterium]MBN51795.1 RnfH family protein [Spongiibacteraceae bacterium]HCS28204.1 RnfH family protein [Spongiibacteraceae bacterium]